MLRAEAIRLGRVACGAVRTFFPARGSRPEKHTLFSGPETGRKPEEGSGRGFRERAEGSEEKRNPRGGFRFSSFLKELLALSIL